MNVSHWSIWIRMLMFHLVVWQCFGLYQGMCFASLEEIPFLFAQQPMCPPQHNLSFWLTWHSSASTTPRDVLSHFVFKWVHRNFGSSTSVCLLYLWKLFCLHDGGSMANTSYFVGLWWGCGKRDSGEQQSHRPGSRRYIGLWRRNDTRGSEYIILWLFSWPQGHWCT